MKKLLLILLFGTFNTYSQNDFNSHLTFFELNNSTFNLVDKSNGIATFKIEDQENTKGDFSTTIIVSELGKMQSSKMNEDTFNRVLDSYEENGYKIFDKKRRGYLKDGKVYNHSSFLESGIEYKNKKGIIYFALILENHVSLMFIGTAFKNLEENKKIFLNIASSAKLKRGK